MKKLNLLLATTAILSMGEMNAMADSVTVSNSETIHMDVKFVEPLTITEDTRLDFGTLVRPRANQTVIFSNGAPNCGNIYALDSNSNATQLYTSGTGSAHKGKILISGLSRADFDSIQPVFTYDSVDLTSGSGDSMVTCGTVTNFPTSTDYPSSGEGMSDTGLICYGATFTVSEDITDQNTFSGTCTGTNTITLVHPIY